MLKIAIITSGYLPVPPTKGGAVENIIYNLIKKNEIYKECFFTIYSIEDDHCEHFKNTEIEYIKVSGFSKILDNIIYFIAKNILRRKHLISYRYFFQRIEFYKKVGKSIDSKEYDRVLLENNVVMFKALVYKKNLKKYKNKIVYHAHNELGKTLGYEKYLNNSKKVIGVSDFITNYFKNFVEKSNVELQTIHNTIDEQIFTRSLTREEIDAMKMRLGINNEYPIILFTGRISEEKGIVELLKALSYLKTNQYNLLIVGKSFFGTQIKDKFEEKLKKISKKVKGNVIFTGLVKYEDMYKYYKISDICVLPSVWNEPCALTIIECIVSGIPLITTNTGGTPENITDSTIMLNIDNLEKNLSEILKDLLENPCKLEILKERAKQEIYKHGTLDEYYYQFVNALK